MTTNEAFARCPICRIRYTDADGIHHGRVPCRAVEFVFGQLVAVGRPRPYTGPDSRWTSWAEATVALGKAVFTVECLLHLTDAYPSCTCDAASLDAAIVGRLLWPYPNTRVIAEAAITRALDHELLLPIDLVFVDPGREYFRESRPAAPSWRVGGPRAA